MAVPKCRDCGSTEWTRSTDPDENGRCVDCRAFPTLGYQVGALIQERVVVPDRDDQGQPFILSVEQGTWTLHFYRIDPHTGRFTAFRGGQWVAPQKFGKGPFSGAIVIAEAHPEGPVRFDGWDAYGQPVGRPWATPWIQITASAERQTANIWDALVPMIQLGDVNADIPDTGKTRIVLPAGGKIEPVTSKGGTARGQRVTHVAQDETSDWLLKDGTNNLADTQRRNLAGTGGRFTDWANAWDPSAPSVAQMTHEEGLKLGVYTLMNDAGPGSIKNKAERRRMIRKVYGSHLVSAGGWVPDERIDAEIVALFDRDPAQAERFFVNRPSSGSGAMFTSAAIDDAVRRGLSVRRTADGEPLGIAIDGARFRDALAVIAVDLETGHKFPLTIQERPDGAKDGYRHNFTTAFDAVIEATKKWDVWRIYVDPQYIDGLFDDLLGELGDDRVIEWYMNRPIQAAHATRRYREGLAAGDFTIENDEVLVRHHRNARKKPTNVKDEKGNALPVVTKEDNYSGKYVDGAAGSILAEEIRGDWIAAGKPRTDPQDRTFYSFA